MHAGKRIARCMGGNGHVWLCGISFRNMSVLHVAHTGCVVSLGWDLHNIRSVQNIRYTNCEQCVCEGKIKKGGSMSEVVISLWEAGEIFFCNTRQMYTICLRLLGINLVFECERGHVHSVGIESRQDTHIYIYRWTQQHKRKWKCSPLSYLVKFMKSKVFVLFYYRP